MKKLLGLAASISVLAACSPSSVTHSALPTTSSVSNAARGTASLTAPSGWATTATLDATIPGATAIGALDGTTPLTVRLGLNLHNVDQLTSLIASRQTITPDQFAAQFGPTSTEVQSVVAYLQSSGFQNIEIGSQLISADGTAAQATKAFNTTLTAYSLGGTSLYVNTQPAYVPTSLGGIVSAVLGLTNAAKMSVSPNATCVGGTLPTGQCVINFDGHSVQKYYDATSTPDGSGTTIAVMAEGNLSGTVTDLRYAEAKLGLPQVPTSIVQVGLASPDTFGAGEWDLDSQSSTGMANNVSHLYLYATTSLTDSDIAHEYSTWVGQHVAMLGNSSFGECEYQAFLDGSMRVDDNLFMQGAAQGQTMFASTGDTGSSCALVGTNGVPGSGLPMVEFPAASAYVVGVGGTSAVANPDGSYLGEVSWNAGGGGLSQFENSTSWQQTAQPTATGLAATNLRGLPDIAMAADPVAGAYEVYGANVPGIGACSAGCAVGGTSEASPLAMGSYARMMSAHGNRLGYGAPLFYANYVEHNGSATTVNGPPPTMALGGFHDIIVGANGAYTALQGYDYTTGLGTFDIGVMNAQIGL